MNRIRKFATILVFSPALIENALGQKADNFTYKFLKANVDECLSTFKITKINDKTIPPISIEELTDSNYNVLSITGECEVSVDSKMSVIDNQVCDIKNKNFSDVLHISLSRVGKKVRLSGTYSKLPDDWRTTGADNIIKSVIQQTSIEVKTLASR